MRQLTVVAMLLLFSMPVHGGDLEANLISDRIQQFHMPHGNLDYGYFYNLIRLEQDRKIRKGYMKSYAKLRKTTQSHLNPFFNMIDFALNGANEARDRETLLGLDAHLLRNRRNVWVDLRGKYKACKVNISCTVIPVAERPYEDFLWQRHPFALSGGGDGSVESPGVDYILPYWMARYYGVNSGDGGRNS